MRAARCGVAASARSRPDSRGTRGSPLRSGRGFFEDRALGGAREVDLRGLEAGVDREGLLERLDRTVVGGPLDPDDAEFVPEHVRLRVARYGLDERRLGLGELALRAQRRAETRRGLLVEGVERERGREGGRRVVELLLGAPGLTERGPHGGLVRRQARGLGELALGFLPHALLAERAPEVLMVERRARIEADGLHQLLDRA